MGKLIDGTEILQCFSCGEREGGYEQTIYCKDCLKKAQEEYEQELDN